MKTRIAMFAIAALAAGGFAQAQEGDQPERPQRERGGRQMPPELLEKFDKDGDGKLSEEERKAAADARRAEMEKRRKEMLAKYDKDGDGTLSEDERKVMAEEMRAKREEILKKYDKDGDGRLSPEERQAAIDAGEEIPRGRPGGPGAQGPRGQRGEGGPGPRGPRGGGEGPAEAPAE